MSIRYLFIRICPPVICRMANAAPPHCKIRSAMNSLQTMKQDINRSLAAVSTFCQEKNLETVSTETKILRDSVQNDIDLILTKLNTTLRDTLAMKAKNTAQKAQIFQLKAEIKRMKDQELSFIQEGEASADVSDKEMNEGSADVSDKEMNEGSADVSDKEIKEVQ